MIEIELKWALALYAGVVGVLITFIWIYTEITVWRPYRYLGQQFLWHCTFCGFTYLDEDSEAVSQCPRCASYNAATDRNARLAPSSPLARAPDTAVQSAQDSRRNPSRRKRPHQRRRGPRKR